MGDDVCTPFKGTAEVRGGEGVVHRQGKSVFVGHPGPALDVEDLHARVGEGFSEHQLGVGPDGGLNLLIAGIGLDEGNLDAHLLQGDAQQVEGASVDIVGGNDVVSAAGDVDAGKQVGRLAGGGEDGAYAAFQVVDLGGRGIHRGVLETGIEVAGLFQVEEFSHLVRGLIFEGGTLDDGNLAGFSLAGFVSCVDAAGVNLCHIVCSFFGGKGMCFGKNGQEISKY